MRNTDNSCFAGHRHSMARAVCTGCAGKRPDRVWRGRTGTGRERGKQPGIGRVAGIREHWDTGRRPDDGSRADTGRRPDDGNRADAGKRAWDGSRADAGKRTWEGYRTDRRDGRGTLDGPGDGGMGPYGGGGFGRNCRGKGYHGFGLFKRCVSGAGIALLRQPDGSHCAQRPDRKYPGLGGG